jgi:hypothetical protein
MLFDLLAVISAAEISPLLLRMLHGEVFSLCWAIMEYMEEATSMMLRDGAPLMRGGGRKAGGERTRGQEDKRRWRASS